MSIATASASPRLSRRLLAGLLALAVVVLTGCGVRLHVDATVSSSNTMDATITVALSSDMAGLAQWDASTCTADMADSAPSGTVSAQAYNQDGYVGCTAAFTGLAIADADVLINGLDNVGSGLGTGSSTNHLTITRDGKTFVVDGFMDMTMDDPTGMLGSAGAVFQMDVKVALSFPGKVLSSNGVITGNTVTWTLALGGDGTMTATAEATAASGLVKTIILVAAAVIVAAILALVAVLVLRARRAKAAASAPPAAPYAPGAVAYAPGVGAYAPGAYDPVVAPDAFAPPSYLGAADPGAGLGTGLGQPAPPVAPAPYAPPVAPGPAWGAPAAPQQPPVDPDNPWRPTGA